MLALRPNSTNGLRGCHGHNALNTAIRWVLASALLWISVPAFAVDQYTCRGKVSGPEGSMRGQVTLSTRSMSVDKKFLWIRDNAAYDFKSLESVRVRRGLLFAKVRMRSGKDGAFIKMRTWAWNYDPVYELLKSKL